MKWPKNIKWKLLIIVLNLLGSSFEMIGQSLDQIFSVWYRLWSL